MATVPKRRSRYKRKCRVCKQVFTPDRRNLRHQKVCSSAHCQRVRRGISQRQWRSKPANRGYWKGSANVERVRQWRARNPGYWSRKSSSQPPEPLQDLLPAQQADNKEDSVGLALQDVLTAQHPFIVGLMACLTGSTLQDHMDNQIRSFILRGLDVLGVVRHSQSASPKNNETCHDKQKTPLSGTAPPCSRTLQLAGPSPGPG